MNKIMYQLSKEDFDAMNLALGSTYQISIGHQDAMGCYLVSADIIERYEAIGKNISVTMENALGKTFEEMDISDSHILRIFDLIDIGHSGMNKRKVPKGLLFNKQLDVFLEKEAVAFDHRGRPTTITYYTDKAHTIPVAKRTFNFIDFDKNTIMALLGVDEMTATVLEDKLLWIRYETFHWAFRDGTWSSDTKVHDEDFIPFVNGQPDLASFYDKRVQERIDGREIILKKIQPVVSKFIAGGLQTTNLILIREVGRAFLKEFKLQFDTYKETGDEEIIGLIINDTTYPFLDYPTDIAGVATVRQYLINKLRQNADLATAI